RKPAREHQELEIQTSRAVVGPLDPFEGRGVIDEGNQFEKELETRERHAVEGLLETTTHGLSRFRILELVLEEPWISPHQLGNQRAIECRVPAEQVFGLVGIRTRVEGEGSARVRQHEPMLL